MLILLIKIVSIYPVSLIDEYFRFQTSIKINNNTFVLLNLNLHLSRTLRKTNTSQKY